MKRLFFILCACMCCASCCLNKPSEIKITNNSSYDVKFSQEAQPSDIYTVEKNSFIYIPVINTAFPKLIIQNNKPVGAHYPYEFDVEIINLKTFSLNVENSTAKSISFSVSNTPDNTIYEVLSGETKNVLIYTNNPAINTSHSHFDFNKNEMTLYFY